MKKYECWECAERSTFTGVCCDNCGWWRPDSYKRVMQKELNALGEKLSKDLIKLHGKHGFFLRKKDEKSIRKNCMETLEIDGTGFPLIDMIMESISEP